MTGKDEESLVDALWGFSLSVISAFALLMLAHPVLLFTLRVLLEIIVFTLDAKPCQPSDVTDWWFCHGWDWPIHAVKDLANTYADAIKKS